MKYTSIIVLGLLGLVEAKHHHHQELSQAPKDDEKASTPDSNRAEFEKSVASAAKVVTTEHSSEADRTSTHAAAMAN